MRREFISYHEATLVAELSVAHLHRHGHAKVAPTPSPSDVRMVIYTDARDGGDAINLNLVRIIDQVGIAISNACGFSRKESGAKLSHLPMTESTFLSQLGTRSLKCAASAFDENLGLALAKDRGAIPEHVRYCRPCIGPCSSSEHGHVKLAKEYVDMLDADVRARVKRIVPPNIAADIKIALRRYNLLLSWVVHAKPHTPQLYIAFVTAPIYSGTGVIYVNAYACLLMVASFVKWLGNNVQWNDTLVAMKCLQHVEPEHD